MYLQVRFKFVLTRIVGGISAFRFSPHVFPTASSLPKQTPSPRCYRAKTPTRKGPKVRLPNTSLDAMADIRVLTVACLLYLQQFLHHRVS